MRCTYDKDVHPASATGVVVSAAREGQRVGAQCEDDEGEDQDGDLDVQEPERLRRDADGDETLRAHVVRSWVVIWVGGWRVDWTATRTATATWISVRVEDGGTESDTQHTEPRIEQIRLGEGRGSKPFFIHVPRRTSFRTRRPTRRHGGLKRRVSARHAVRALATRLG